MVLGRPAGPDDVPAAAVHPDERARAARMGPARRREFATGRSLLRSTLAVLLDVPAAGIGVDVTGTGSLRLAAPHQEVGVSIAHAGDLFAVAVCPGGVVGVDLQPEVAVSRRRRERWGTLPAYAGAVAAGAGQERRAFAEVWSVQEAVAKCWGTGLAARPWTIPLAPGRAPGGVHWRLVAHDAGGFALAVAAGRAAVGRFPQ